MQITDSECEELRRICLEHDGIDLTVDEAREIFSRMTFLVERFSAWLAKQRAAGREFPLDGPPPFP